jgi:hypothetical protein
MPEVDNTVATTRRTEKAALNIPNFSIPIYGEMEISGATFCPHRGHPNRSIPETQSNWNGNGEFQINLL